MVNHFNQMFDTWPVTWLWPFRSCPRACCPYWSARSAWRPSPSRPFPAAVTGTLSARSAGPGHTTVQSAGRTFTPPQSASPRRPTVCWRSSPASPAPTSTSAAPSAPPCSPSRLTSWPVRTTHTSLNRSIWPPKHFFLRGKLYTFQKTYFCTGTTSLPEISLPCRTSIREAGSDQEILSALWKRFQ